MKVKLCINPTEAPGQLLRIPGSRMEVKSVCDLSTPEDEIRPSLGV